MVHRFRLTIVMAALLGAAAFPAAQTLDPGATFRVFLRNGSVLPSYGEYAVAGDRLVFVLPIAAVDMPRTTRYALGMRARTYAETRGPADYSEIAASVTETLAAIDKEP